VNPDDVGGGRAKTLRRPRGNWTATTLQALLYAVPLIFVALLAAQWLDVDYFILRENVRRQAQNAAETMGVAAAERVTNTALYARIDVERAAAEGLSPPSALWRVIANYDFDLLVLIRDGEVTIFPPEDPLAMPKVWEEKLRTLQDVASLLSEGGFVNGWFPSAAGEYYFECRRAGANAERRENCLALNEKFIVPEMSAALNDLGKGLPGWSLRLRDPFGRIVWRQGDATQGFESFHQTGPLRGWAMDVFGPAAPSHSAFGRLALAAPLALVWLLLAWQARRTARARLAEAAQRAALAARLSHDLRTPLANLKLYAELISRKANSLPELDRYCAVLWEEIDRLDVLAGETISSQGDGGPAPALSVADPCALARRVVARYEKLLAASGSVCSVQCGAEAPLSFDAGAFERILVNLVDNARKYAPGKIDVGIDWREGFLSLTVRDYGAPSPPRAKKAGPSHGFGLSIVQELARANGGAFALSGADPGLCARATIRAEPERDAA
jgi:signal transduction histidine kinase